jgi:amino acid adenylation domain-containing protein/thioester reductase-like protein
VAGPDKPAVISSGEILSYGELQKRSKIISSLALGKEVPQGPLVAVVMEKGWEQAAAVLGILQAGKAYLPVDPSFPEDRLKYLLEDGGVKLVLTQSRFEDKIAWPEGLVVIPVDTVDYTREYFMAEPVRSTPDDLAYVIYTSGSTGFPKGVMINHRGAVNTILDINKRFSVGQGDRVLAISSLHFDLSVYDIFGILAAGGAIVLPDADRRTDPGHWARLVEQERVTVWNTVPALMQLYVEYLEDRSVTPGDSLKLVLMSGDWIPVDLPERIRSKFGDLRLISLGGATEASIWSILYPIGEVDPHWKSIPYGRPMGNQRFYVLNKWLEECPDWVTGQLYIGGEGLAPGYWNDSEKTQARFITHPKTGERLYNTGDMGRFRSDGTIEFLGREDFQVKIRGYRIELEEIESVLKQHQSVQNAVVNVYTGVKGERRLVGYVTGNKEKPPVMEELQSFLENKLPGYMVPKDYMLLETLPLSSNGKVDRKALPGPYHAGESCREEYVGPRNPLEKRLSLLWAEALERDRVGIHDEFFSIGGDSLIATRLVLKIREALKVNLSLPRLFDAPTVAGLAELIKSSEDIPSEIEMELLSSHDLRNEAVLEPEITAGGLPVVHAEEPSMIFLTGATGFLGAFLLHDLLHSTKARIYCLVRAANNKEGLNRLKKNLEYYSLRDPLVEDRIIAVAGDLSAAYMGLSRKDYQYLADNIEVIYHSGALVHFLYSYSLLKPVNVTGTKEVLRFACRSGVKPVHYVSTMSVFSEHGSSGTRVIREDNHIDSSGILDTGYAQSKWVAEKLVWIAASREIPVTVYRLGLTMGDSRSGVWSAGDFLSYLFKGSLQVGCLPGIDAVLDAIPVDYASKAIVEFSLQKDCRGKVFHLAHPRPVHLDYLVNWIRSKGHVMEEVSYENWRARLLERSSENVLYPLLPMFPETLEEEDGKLVFSMENTVKSLKNISLQIPAIDDRLLNVYYSYFTSVGFITKGAGM